MAEGFSHYSDEQDSRGHVFVLHTDIRRLTCDAWAIPGHTKSAWFSEPPEIAAREVKLVSLSPRISRIEFVDHEDQQRHEPYRYKTTIVSAHGKSHVHHLGTVAQEFLSTAHADLMQIRPTPLNNRARLLLAMPILGTGGAGARPYAGAVLQQLFDVMYEKAESLKCDIALVTNEQDMFLAAQAERARRGVKVCWQLPNRLFAAAKRLARQAMQGKLVCFLGAGISAGAGLPLWGGLLDDIAKTVELGPTETGESDTTNDSNLSHGSPPSPVANRPRSASYSTASAASAPLPPHPAPLQRAHSHSHGYNQGPALYAQLSEDVAPDTIAPAAAAVAPLLPGQCSEDERRKARQRTEFESMSFLDRARIIEKRLEQRGIQLGDEVAARLKSSYVSTAHVLVASIPHKATITTNYDTLYEQSVQAQGKTISVLPHQPKRQAASFVLKMHGCVTRPSTIILTRSDYIRYNETSAALGGIVQSLLLTQHMLFIGFSLEDDNFHRLFDAVIKAVSGNSSNGSVQHFGTVLCLHLNSLQRELWGEHLSFAHIWDEDEAFEEAATHAQAAPEKPSISTVARIHDIVLDLCVHCCTVQAPPVLNAQFDALLTKEDRLFREHFIKFWSGLPSEARHSSAFKHLEKLLKQLIGSERPRDLAVWRRFLEQPHSSLSDFSGIVQSSTYAQLEVRRYRQSRNKPNDAQSE